MGSSQDLNPGPGYRIGRPTSRLNPPHHNILHGRHILQVRQLRLLELEAAELDRGRRACVVPVLWTDQRQSALCTGNRGHGSSGPGVAMAPWLGCTGRGRTWGASFMPTMGRGEAGEAPESGHVQEVSSGSWGQVLLGPPSTRSKEPISRMKAQRVKNW